jgi:uncharacterized protein (DUF433 family)
MMLKIPFCIKIHELYLQSIDRSVSFMISKEQDCFPLDNYITSNLLPHITHNPDIYHGKLCVRRLRYPIEFILELLSSGMTHAEILADYEDLESEDFYAVLLFSERLSQVKSV